MAVVQIEFGDKKLEALLMFLSDNKTTIDKELTDALNAIWETYVPADVRSFVERCENPEPPVPGKRRRSASPGKATSAPASDGKMDTAIPVESALCAVVEPLQGDTVSKDAQ